MAVCVHLCRGNYQSAWVAKGGYEPVAEILFNELLIDGFFLEYDDDRSGDFSPLRFVPKGKSVVLGIMTSKRPDLESPAALERRVAEANRFLSMDQLAISPQCGFSSTAHGNLLTEEEQWKKLARLVEVASRLW
jgi:5-methyltetrahydropteroyltriglutamate--homocysteine methyltransferase